MHRDQTPRNDPLPTLDDAQLGELVRAVADDWRRPPQRMGETTWRERVEVRGTGGRGTRRGGWFGRLAGAASFAVVASVALAITAVYLSGPRGDRGVVPSLPGVGASPTAPTLGTPLPTAASPLPALLQNGELPSVTTVLLQGSGGFRFADLATGTLKPKLPWDGSGWDPVFARPGGGWVCVCGAYEGGSGATTTSSLIIDLRSVDASGEPDGAVQVTALQSEPGSSPPASDSLSVDASATLMPDGRRVAVGWSQRLAAGWQAGVTVVDLASLTVLGSVVLPEVDRSAAAAGKAWVRLAPRVAMSPSGGVALISSDWFAEDETTATPPFGTDRWSATVTDSTLRDIVAAGERSDRDCGEWERGLIDDASFYVTCTLSDGTLRIDRYDLDGSAIDRTKIDGWTNFGAIAARSGDDLYLWDPRGHTLVRFDLVTTASDRVTAPDSAAVHDSGDLTARLGRSLGAWLAPTALAKVILQPALAISPDGTALYALGTDGGSIERFGSAGVFAFDIGSGAPAFRGQWQPTADFISIAVSEDGAFVYAAGMGGVDANGTAAPFQASVTVYDASDGSVRLLAGQLAGAELLFVEPTVR